MLSDKIKTALLGYWRGRNYHASVEVRSPYGDIEDIVAMKGDELVVVEVKISIADLHRDIKKRKHIKLAKKNLRHMANNYFFCVPEDLVDKASVILAKKYPLFGLIAYYPDHSIKVIKRSKKVTKSKSQIFKKQIINSLANQLIKFMEQKFF